MLGFVRARAHVRANRDLKALFTRREGYPSKRVTLARTHLFLFSSSCLQGGQGYPGRRVTLSAC